MDKLKEIKDVIDSARLAARVSCGQDHRNLLESTLGKIEKIISADFGRDCSGVSAKLLVIEELCTGCGSCDAQIKSAAKSCVHGAIVLES